MRIRILACLLALVLSPVCWAQTYVLFNTPHQQFLDTSGRPLAGGRIFTYAAGTTTPQVTYQDSTGTPNTNPIVLDSGGFGTIYLNTTLSYKVVMKNAMGVQQWSIDNIAGTTGTISTVPLNSILPATGTNSISNGNNTQIWGWQLTGSSPEQAFWVNETAPSTNSGSGSFLLGASTLNGSTIWPFRVSAQLPTGNGVGVTPSGDTQTLGAGRFLGPLVGNVTGNLTGNASTASSVPLNGIANATGFGGSTHGNNGQHWQWQLTGSVGEQALWIDESAPSTNTGGASFLLGASTQAGSTIWPFRAWTGYTGSAGFGVTPTGDAQIIGAASFRGPLVGNVTGNISGATGTFTGNVTAGSFTGPLTGNVSGNASSATALATTPAQCSGSQFATGVQANGNANCNTPTGTGTLTSFTAGNLSPLFTTSVATPTTTPALSFSLSNVAANTILGNFTGASAAPSFNAMVACGDGTHALAWTPGSGFTCQTLTAGSGIASINGNTTAAQNIVGTAPVTVSSVGGTTTISSSSYPVANISGTYNATSADFQNCAVKYSNSAAAVTVNLVANTSQPPNGQCLIISNYGTGTITVVRNGQTINGQSSNPTINPIVGATQMQPNSITVWSDGTNYFITRGTSFFPFSNVTTGTATSTTLTVGTGSSVTPSGTGVVNANQVNAATIPVSSSILASNASNQIVDGSGGAVTVGSLNVTTNSTVTGTETVGRLTVNGGVSQGSGIKAIRAGSCTTPATLNGNCSSTLNWATAFADTSYTVTCSIAGGTVFLPTITSPTAASVTVLVQNNGTSTAAAGTIECIGIHD